MKSIIIGTAGHIDTAKQRWSSPDRH